jgi:hypothetical protein
LGTEASILVPITIKEKERNIISLSSIHYKNKLLD